MGVELLMLPSVGERSATRNEGLVTRGSQPGSIEVQPDPPCLPTGRESPRKVEQSRQATVRKGLEGFSGGLCGTVRALSGERWPPRSFPVSARNGGTEMRSIDPPAALCPPHGTGSPIPLVAGGSVDRVEVDIHDGPKVSKLLPGASRPKASGAVRCAQSRGFFAPRHAISGKPDAYPAGQSSSRGWGGGVDIGGN